MSKTAISVTLAPENLLWLKARARVTDRRSVSAVLDALLEEARRKTGPARSVVGRVQLPQGDEGLEKGSQEIRRLLQGSVSRRRRSTRARG